MKNLLKKIQAVRDEIRLGKDGENSFQKYKYFTPESIISAVNPILKKHNLIALFNMEWSAGKSIYEAKLEIIDLENDNLLSQTFQFDICKGEVKGTNESQASGSTLTYGKRYSYMNAFDIVDNRDDLDSNEISQKQAQKEKKTENNGDVEKKIKTFNNVEELGKFFKSLSPELQKQYAKVTTERKAALENGK